MFITWQQTEDNSDMQRLFGMDILLNVQFIAKQRCTGYLQMLFLSWERMRERFDVLWPVGIYFWVQRSCDFMNEQADLLY